MIWNKFTERYGLWTARDFGGGSKQSGTQTVVQSNNPPGYAQPYLSDVLGQAQSQYNTNKTQPMYPNSTVVPFSNQTESALQGIEERATAGSPLTNAAQGNLQSTLEGDFLSADNPYFNQVAERVKAEVLPSINAGFNAAGRTGSGLAARAASEGLGDALGTLAYQNYADERTKQVQAAGLAPGLAAEDYNNLSQLAGVGSAREGMAANQLQEQINRYNYPQQSQQDALANYAALVSGGTVGSAGQSSQPIYTNPTANLLGGALGTAGLANSLFSSGGGQGLLKSLGIF